MREKVPLKQKRKFERRSHLLRDMPAAKAARSPVCRSATTAARRSTRIQCVGTSSPASTSFAASKKPRRKAGVFRSFTSGRDQYCSVLGNHGAAAEVELAGQRSGNRLDIPLGVDFKTEKLVVRYAGAERKTPPISNRKSIAGALGRSSIT